MRLTRICLIITYSEVRFYLKCITSLYKTQSTTRWKRAQFSIPERSVQVVGVILNFRGGFYIQSQEIVKKLGVPAKYLEYLVLNIRASFSARDNITRNERPHLGTQFNWASSKSDVGTSRGPGVFFHPAPVVTLEQHLRQRALKYEAGDSKAH